MQTIGSDNRIVSVAAFVDWNAQLLLTRRDTDADPESVAELAFRQTTRRIARCLDDLDSRKRFRVNIRLYHGWHRGYEPTANRKAVKVVVGRADFATLSQRPNVVFSPNVGFGDRLINALERRLHTRLAIHLPNTLRKRYGETLEEKMVDTALAADVVATAHRDSNDWIVVVTEDDDLIPSVFVAEAALLGSGAKVVLLRKRVQASMMMLDDLLVNG
ncbi:MAG: hypothetical protein Q8R69_13165 [Telluria sp.]|nr:hypothetical protein [Telluria sp.]